MTVTSHLHGRLGARHRATLKKWSDKVAREGNVQTAASASERLVLRRRRALEGVRKKLRDLFH
jgi:hypothetical protein